MGSVNQFTGQITAVQFSQLTGQVTSVQFSQSVRQFSQFTGQDTAVQFSQLTSRVTSVQFSQFSQFTGRVTAVQFTQSRQFAGRVMAVRFNSVGWACWSDHGSPAEIGSVGVGGGSVSVWDPLPSPAQYTCTRSAVVSSVSLCRYVVMSSPST